MSLTLSPTAQQYAKKGTLYIHDYFSGKKNRPEHGELVAKSAQETGFKGSVVGQQVTNPTTRVDALYSTSTSTEDFNKAFKQQIIDMRKNPLESATKTMHALDKQGVKNSALNLSQGGSKASTVDHFYSSMRRAWAPEDERSHSGEYLNRKGKGLLTNFAKANGLDEAKLLSKDPKVYGPERAKLQEALINQVQDTVNGSKEVKKAQSDYDTAVKAFESRNNSVVVAGENDGNLVGTFRKDLGGHKAGLTVNKNFFDNPLANDQTTIVGALNDQGTKASYSTRSSLPEIYANGRVDTDQWGSYTEGTSFSAPRVAALMARIHEKNPHLTSQQVEDQVIQTMTKPQGEGKKQIRVLDRSVFEKVY